MFEEKFFYNNQIVTILICANGRLDRPMNTISAIGLLKCYGRRQKMAKIEIFGGIRRGLDQGKTRRKARMCCQSTALGKLIAIACMQRSSQPWRVCNLSMAFSRSRQIDWP